MTDNPETFVVFWRSRITGHWDNGTSFLTKETAERIAQEQNKLHPDIHHWVEDLCTWTDEQRKNSGILDGEK